MSTINAANLELKLVQKINSTTAPLELLALGTALRQLQNGAVFVVQRFSQLPLASANLGSLYFVIDDGVVYVSTPGVSGSEVWTSLASDAISELSTWGRNTWGQLGDGTTQSRSSPGNVCGGGTIWCQASSGFSTTAAVKTDGTAWTWGFGSNGSLGNGFMTTQSSPGTLAGGGNTWCQIDVGSNHAAAVKTDGSAWTWGTNECGQLGNSTVATRCSPGTLSGGGNTWCQISAGRYITAAVKTDGSAWTWGCNNCGQLGDGTTVSRSSPGAVAGVNSDWCAIDVGSAFTAAIKTDGSAWTWGLNTFGELGDGTTVAKSSPGAVAGTNTLWCQISAGFRITAAVKTDGTAWTWGCNTYGQLGDGTTVNRSSPGAVAGSITPWCQIHASNSYGSVVIAIASKTL